jgi:hypothetical protein
VHVVDQAPAAWYLLADGDGLFLDVNCSHGAFGYSVLIELDQSERTRWAELGRGYLDTLSQAVQDSAPLVDATSPYRARDLTSTRSNEVSDAVRRWRAGT